MPVDFSIVIPAYNNLSLLQRALDSAWQQQGVEFEVIVTDDSTTTDIAQYVATLGDRRLRTETAALYGCCIVAAKLVGN